jgi:hypothetical protein
MGFHQLSQPSRSTDPHAVEYDRIPWLQVRPFHLLLQVRPVLEPQLPAAHLAYPLTSLMDKISTVAICISFLKSVIFNNF